MLSFLTMATVHHRVVVSVTVIVAVVVGLPCVVIVVTVCVI